MIGNYEGVVTTAREIGTSDELINGLFTFPDQDEIFQGTYVLAAETNPTLIELINSSTPGKETKGRTRQFETSGGFEKANEIFDSLNLSSVRELTNSELNGRIGTLEDGRTVIVRDGSKGEDGGFPTLEIQSGRKFLKFRFK